MKKIYMILFVTFCFSQLVRAQWTQVFGGSELYTLRGVYFSNADTGYVVGGVETGTTSPEILKTTDGGTNWTEQTVELDSGLRAIHCFDPNHCIACGWEGRIVKTEDGGTTWDVFSGGTTQTLRSIDFPSSDTGYACGSLGTIIKTTDGGLTWTSQSSGLSGDLINIRFATNDIGYAVQSGPSTLSFPDGYVIKTTDGGATWSTVYHNVDIGLLGLAVVDESTIYTGGKNETIEKTIDGGTNWTSPYSALAGVIRTAAAPDAGHIWLGSDNGDILYTSNEGATWTNQTINFNGIYGMSFPSASIGYGVGSAGSILKYFCLIPATPDLSSDPLTICSGDTLIFTISEIEDATGYKWILPEEAYIIDGDGTTTLTVVFGSASGDISVFATGACVDGEAAFESITVNVTPAVPTITFNSGVLSSSASSGNQWYLNGSEIPGAVNQTYTPTQNGTYSVVVTSAEGCSSHSEPLEVVGVGIGNVYRELSFTIYPNPMNQFTQINISSQDASLIIISDVQGKLILSIPVTTSQIVLSKNDLSDGMYMVQLLNSKNELISRSKLIVQ